MRLLIIIIFLFLFAIPTYAHVIRTDGTFEGMLHILPDDIAYAGTTTNFYFLFEEDKKVTTNCKCSVSITKIPEQTVLFSKEQIRDKFAFEFPSIGVYQARIYRNDFSMSWDIRVETEIKKPSWFSVFVEKIRVLLGR